MTPVELNRLFELKGYRKFKETTIQNKIDILLGKEHLREVNRLKFEKYALKDPIKYRARCLYNNAKQRAKTKGIPFDIELNYIEDKLKEGICESTGARFIIKKYSKKNGYEKINSLSPSIDQILPSKGYTKENIKVVCDHFNKMKSDKSLEETYYIAKKFVMHYEKQIKYKLNNQLKLFN